MGRGSGELGGPTLAPRPATPAWAFVAEVGGGTGREKGGEGGEEREGRRGKGEQKRGTGEWGGDDLSKDEIDLNASSRGR